MQAHELLRGVKRESTQHLLWEVPYQGTGLLKHSTGLVMLLVLRSKLQGTAIRDT